MQGRVVLALCAICVVSMLGVDASCSGQDNCVACLTNSPAFGFGWSGKYCKFCPSPSLTQRYPDDHASRDPSGKNPLHGACWDEASRDELAEDTTIEPAHLGGCRVDPTELPGSDNKTPNLINGWITPVEKPISAGTTPTPLTVEEAIVICNRYKVTQSEAAKATGLGSSVSTYLEGEMYKSRQTLQVLQSLADDIARAQYLRAVDPVFYGRTFAGSTEKLYKAGSESAYTVLTTTVGLLSAPIGYIITGVETAVDIGKAVTRKAVEPLFVHGGEATSRSFRDLNYNQIMMQFDDILKQTYVEVDEDTRKKLTPEEIAALRAEQVPLQAFRNPVALLQMLKEQGDKIIESWGTGALTGLSVANKINTHPAAVAAKLTAHIVVAIVTAGVSIPVSIAISAGELALNQGLKLAERTSLEWKIFVLLTGVYAKETMERQLLVAAQSDSYSIVDKDDFENGPIVCSILDLERPNHGCARGMFCKREFLFYPYMKDRYNGQIKKSTGICSPIAKRQAKIGSPCLLHSDCLTGYCSFGGVTLELKKRGAAGKGKSAFISAKNRFVRSDMPTDENPVSSDALKLEERWAALSGSCMAVGRNGEPGVTPIVEGDASFDFGEMRDVKTMPDSAFYPEEMPDVYKEPRAPSLQRTGRYEDEDMGRRELERQAEQDSKERDTAMGIHSLKQTVKAMKDAGGGLQPSSPPPRMTRSKSLPLLSKVFR